MSWSRQGGFLVSGAWPALANGAAGVGYETQDGPFNAFVTVGGTFGTGGSVSMEGSADGVNWVTLSLNPSGAATFTAAGGGSIAGSPRFIRPRVTAGDGTTAIVAQMSVQSFNRDQS